MGGWVDLSLKTTLLTRTFNFAVMDCREAAYDAETVYGGADRDLRLAA